MNNENTETKEIPIVKVMQDDEKRPWYMKSKTSVNCRLVASYIMEEAEKNNHRYVTIDDVEADKDQPILYYDKGVYKYGAEVRIKVETQRICDNESSRYVQTEVVNFIRHDTFKPRELFNIRNTTEINMANGIYDYSTHKLLDHTPDKLYTFQIPVEYNEHAEAKHFDVFLSSILTPEYMKLFMEGFAYCFVNHHRIQNYFFLVGGGEQGKGTIMTLMKAMLGYGNVMSASLQGLEADKNYLQAQLFNKMANICGDMPNSELKHTTFIRQATGEDSITVRNIWGKPFDMNNICKFFFSINDIPEFVEDNHGTWRRPIPILFEHKITEEEKDINLRAKLSNPHEMSGIFNELMFVLKNLLKAEKFSTVLSIEEVQEMFSDMADPLKTFLDKYVISSKESFIVKRTLYEEYCAWCKTKNVNPKPENKFGGILKSIKGDYKFSEGRPSVDGTQKNSWMGKVLTSNFRCSTESDPSAIVTPKIKLLQT